MTADKGSIETHTGCAAQGDLAGSVTTRTPAPANADAINIAWCDLLRLIKAAAVAAIHAGNELSVAQRELGEGFGEFITKGTPWHAAEASAMVRFAREAALDPGRLTAADDVPPAHLHLDQLRHEVGNPTSSRYFSLVLARVPSSADGILAPAARELRKRTGKHGETRDARRGCPAFNTATEGLAPFWERSFAVLGLSRKKNESIVISDYITIVVVEIRGDKVRLGVAAPKEVPVHRREVYDRIHRGEAPVLSGARGRGCLASNTAMERHIPFDETSLGMLVLSRKKNESIVIGDDITIVVVAIRGGEVRLGVKAPKEVPIHRREVYDRIHREESQAVVVVG